MMDESFNFKLYANCVLCRGFSRSAIYDLQKNVVHLIPNSLYQLLVEYGKLTPAEIKKVFQNEHDEIIDDYFNFLMENDLLFTFESQNLGELFPDLDFTFKAPFEIDNCIWDISQTTEFSMIERVASDLNNINCSHLEVRNFSALSITHFEQLLKSFESTTILNIELIVCFNPEVSLFDWYTLCDAYPRLTQLTIHSSNDSGRYTSYKYNTPIELVKSRITSEKHCGKISESFFTPNIETYTESLYHNTCLNRKIAIDINGDIKNCPSMKESFGNIKDITLETALSKANFKKLWNVKKDEILKCRDCEFRHVCTDCRAYVDDPNDTRSAPLKCGYDPYTCEWDDWSNNPTKEQAIMYYSLKDIL